MKEKKPNPDNSTIIQVLLDLKKIGYGETSINDVLEIFQTDSDKLKEIEDIFHSHRYPVNALTFTRYNNVNKCKIEYSLEPNALKILIVFIKGMNQINLISISQSYLAVLTEMSKNTLKKAITTLIKCGCIAIFMKSDKKNSAIYMVNPKIALIGKSDEKKLNALFKTISDKENIQVFEQTQISDEFISLGIKSINQITQDNKNIVYNTYCETMDIEKKSLSNTQTIDPNNIISNL